MLAFHQPSWHVRPAELSETSLIGFLRLTSLLSLEIPGASLCSIRAVMSRLPDIGPDLIEAGQYFVADHDGELLGGAGWSVLPLRFRAEHLVDEHGRAARLSLVRGSVLVRGFFLDPDLGRRGAGASLLARIEADAGNAGHSAAELLVPASSQLYYRSLGFKPLARFGLHLDRGDMLPLIQMRKSFQPGVAMAA
jgi:GNAT superfamily N-acetyltransferase